MHGSDNLPDSNLLIQHQISDVRVVDLCHSWFEKQDIHSHINLIPNAVPTTVTISSTWPLRLITTIIYLPNNQQTHLHTNMASWNPCYTLTNIMKSQSLTIH